MNITSLKLGYRTFLVEDMPVSEARSEGRHGAFWKSQGKIRVDQSFGDVYSADTIIHEVLHGLISDSGLNRSDEEEENLVQHLAPRLSAFLVDNPKEVKELLDMLQASSPTARKV